jgi:hypothetical protein
MHRYLPDILTAEDSANDAELSIGALAEYNMANRVVLVSNSADAPGRRDSVPRRRNWWWVPSSKPAIRDDADGFWREAA